MKNLTKTIAEYMRSLKTDFHQYLYEIFNNQTTVNNILTKVYKLQNDIKATQTDVSRSLKKILKFDKISSLYFQIVLGVLGAIFILIILGICFTCTRKNRYEKEIRDILVKEGNRAMHTCACEVSEINELYEHLPSKQ